MVKYDVCIINMAMIFSDGRTWMRHNWFNGWVSPFFQTVQHLERSIHWSRGLFIVSGCSLMRNAGIINKKVDVFFTILLIHSAVPQSRPVVMIIFAHISIRPHFLKHRKAKQRSPENNDHYCTSGTVSLAQGISYDICLATNISFARVDFTCSIYSKTMRQEFLCWQQSSLRHWLCPGSTVLLIYISTWMLID